MAVPRVSKQAGKGGAELQELGALARYTQDAIGQTGAPVKAVAGAAATGSFTISSNSDVSASDTVTLGDTVLTFVASDPDTEAGEVEVGSDASGTRDNLLAALQAVAAEEGVSVEASSTNAITVTALAAGTAGNSITLSDTSDGTTVVAMAGGVNYVAGTAAPAGSIRVNGTKAWIAVTATTESDTSGWKELTVGSGL